MSRMDAADIEALLLSGRPAWEKDEAFWAYIKKHDYPLTQYDLSTWEGCRREGDPLARAISDTSSLLEYIEGAWEGHRIEINAKGGKAEAKITLTDPSIYIGVSAGACGQFTLSDLGSCLAIAFIKANDLALNLQSRMLQVYDVEAPPYEEWPIEPAPDGGFHAVHHGLRLACHSWNSEKLAVEYLKSNHKGQYGIMLCRERYDRLFPEPEDNPDSPGF